jgi:hypothetical protein
MASNWLEFINDLVQIQDYGMKMKFVRDHFAHGIPAWANVAYSGNAVINCVTAAPDSIEINEQAAPPKDTEERRRFDAAMTKLSTVSVWETTRLIEVCYLDFRCPEVFVLKILRVRLRKNVKREH